MRWIILQISTKYREILRWLVQIYHRLEVGLIWLITSVCVMSASEQVTLVLCMFSKELSVQSLQLQYGILSQNPTLASAVKQTASQRCNSPQSPRVSPESMKTESFSESISKKDNNSGLNVPEETSTCLASSVHFLKLSDMKISCCLFVWPKSYLTVFWCVSCLFPINPMWTLTLDSQSFRAGLDVTQSYGISAFPFVLTSCWKHWNRFSADVLLRCVSSYGDSSETWKYYYLCLHAD